MLHSLAEIHSASSNLMRASPNPEGANTWSDESIRIESLLEQFDLREVNEPAVCSPGWTHDTKHEDIIAYEANILIKVVAIFLIFLAEVVEVQ
ncbi:predicted protein [Sclerotinia sclerotiorum 1980 UF-70]|uniref:Uncharacterized protein n=1 Tax=Sclerotinia sclerotiorum (strain ATCC 18683 / 1980 / Ss-1) TaxID=665079 RepID=A7F0R4_SCLS1|nr:predicted protein [Sclerotinia sclerotiorum 1980 UF-70]EDN95306.1 predicted protein [Sclerotinia sclerotiorum 1980 UF-70]